MCLYWNFNIESFSTRILEDRYDIQTLNILLYRKNKYEFTFSTPLNERRFICDENYTKFRCWSKYVILLIIYYHFKSLLKEFVCLRPNGDTFFITAYWFSSNYETRRPIFHRLYSLNSFSNQILNWLKSKKINVKYFWILLCVCRIQCWIQ